MMKKAIFSLTFFVLFCGASFAQQKHALLEIDKSTILRSITLNFNQNEAKLIVITENKSSSKVHFTPYLVVLKDNKIFSQKAISMTEVGDKKEERILSFAKTGDGSILLLSASDKKEMELVARIFSSEGEIMVEKRITDNVLKGSENIDISDKSGTIKLSYYDKDAKTQNFLFYNNKLEELLKKDVSIGNLSDDKYTIDNVLYENDYAYCTNFYALEKKDELGKTPQLTFYKINLSKESIPMVKKTIQNKNHLMYPRYFIRKGVLEIFTIAAAIYDNASFADLNITPINLQSLDIRDFLTDYQLAGYNDIKSEILLKDTSAGHKKLPGLRLSKNHVSINEAEQKEFNKAFGAMTSSVNFQVKYDEMHRSYSIFYRLGTETKTRISEYNSTYNRMEQKDLYSTSFADAKLYRYDADSNALFFVYRIPNSFSMGSNVNSRLYLSYKPGGDFSMVSDIIRNTVILSYVTGVDDVDHAYNAHILDNTGKMVQTLSIKPEVNNGKPFFYLKTLQQIGENRFFCELYIRGEGDRLFVFEINEN